MTPIIIVVLPIRSTMMRWLFSGRPRQFMVIWENGRCWILFHLLAPGGSGSGDGQPRLGGERGQLDLAGAHPVAVRAAAVVASQRRPEAYREPERQRPGEDGVRSFYPAVFPIANPLTRCRSGL